MPQKLTAPLFSAQIPSDWVKGHKQKVFINADWKRYFNIEWFRFGLQEWYKILVWAEWQLQLSDHAILELCYHNTQWNC